jgi:trans-aconitate 2-methyltransferase
MEAQLHRGHLAGTNWNTDQYQKFGNHRTRPALELLERLPLAEPQRIYDLGCGTGNEARLMAERWPAAEIYGVDNSAEMLGKASEVPSRVEWIEADISNWQPETNPDLLYANASLQWVGHHRELLPRLLNMLTVGGVLAVQMPLSWNAPSHRLMRETLQNGGPDGQAIGPETLRQALGRNWVNSAPDYYDLLAGHASELDIWETEYLQVLTGKDPILEWVKGTGLRPVLNGLDDASRELFLSEYRLRLREAYPERSDGKTLYPFRRLFIVATKRP